MYGRLNSAKSNMVQLAKAFTAPPNKKKRSADGQVVERQYKPYTTAELVKAVQQALALGDHIDSADIETNHEDIYEKTIDYSRAVKKLRKGLLNLPQHRRFTDMCKTTNPDGMKVWKLRDDGTYESELTVFHYLLSYYEVPMLLWTADFFNERDWYMDVYIHDGSLIRRREFAKDNADAQAQLREFKALGLVDQCEEHVRDMMKDHYDVPIRPTLGMKSLTE